MSEHVESHDAWNPGLLSRIPSSLQSSITLFRAENSTVDYRTAKELSDFCGLKPAELVAFRIERLIVHNLLVRVTSDLSVPDGPNYEDLGISLRSMVHNIYSGYVLPDIQKYQQAFDSTRVSCDGLIKDELEAHLFSTPVAASPGNRQSLLSRVFKLFSVSEQLNQSDGQPNELVALECWRRRIAEEKDEFRKTCLQSVHRVVDAVVAHRGRMVNQPELVTRIATNMAMNHCGSHLVESMLHPVFKSAVEQEGFRWLPTQSRPVVMNVKGASASGKSTIRPQQRQLAEKLNILWEDFALISPDYWRKYLLDYDSLGDDYKYAAMLTGQELELVDKKLDQFVANKAASGAIPHLLIDRFRFDSFSVEAGKSQDSKLLSRFGESIYLFFMVTPPAETVVRAWERGKTTGRYKAVDDLLYHNVEAFTGMPELFLSWVLSADKEVQFEFLDNSVPKGQLPATAAFGRNNEMTILDLDIMLAIDRYRLVNVDAVTTDEVLLPVEDPLNGAFLRRCLTSIKRVNFAEQQSGEVYATSIDGKIVWYNAELLHRQPGASILEDYLPESITADAPLQLQREASASSGLTLGRWGN